jgi:ribose transport system ATP-binding protein
MSDDLYMKSDDALLKMTGINKSFPGVRALQNVHLEVRGGQAHALLGENGAGKSTLLKILSGAYARDSGVIEFAGKNLHQITPKSAREIGISIIYQEFSSIPYLSVAENIFLGRLPRRKNGLVDWKKCYKQSAELLDTLGLEIDPGIHVSKLKIAQQQMVEIAKAISIEAKIIIMDEPTAPLTEREIGNLFNVIRRLKANGVGIVYVSHRLVEIQQICDEVTVLRDGCNVGSGRVADLNIDDMIRWMVGRNLNVMYPRSGAKIGNTVLSVQNLSVRNTLHSISFDVRKGEIFGLAGLVGAGRTELARALFGADPIDSGKIILEGKELNIKNPANAIASKIGLVPEDRKGQGLVLMMDVKNNISLASLRSFISFGKLNLYKEESVAESFVEKLAISTPDIFTEVNNLSGGNQQKVVLSKWLCANCHLLIVDEPTRGIDVGAKVEIYGLINDLARNDIAVIMISSELPELIGICDRIAVMHEGKLAGTLERDAFSEENIMRIAVGQARGGGF